jgi:hypothetical protein
MIFDRKKLFTEGGYRKKKLMKETQIKIFYNKIFFE